MKRIIALTTVLCISAGGTIASEADKYKIRVEESIQVEMRDGINLSMDIYFPEGKKGKLPTILQRTAYSKARENSQYNEYQFSLVKRGYALAIVDMRGRFESEGRYKPGMDGREDAYDTVSWITDQPWSNQRPILAWLLRYGRKVNALPFLSIFSEWKKADKPPFSESFRKFQKDSESFSTWVF